MRRPAGRKGGGGPDRLAGAIQDGCAQDRRAVLESDEAARRASAPGDGSRQRDGIAINGRISRGTERGGGGSRQRSDIRETHGVRQHDRAAGCTACGIRVIEAGEAGGSLRKGESAGQPPPSAAVYLLVNPDIRGAAGIRNHPGRVGGAVGALQIPEIDIIAPVGADVGPVGDV